MINVNAYQAKAEIKAILYPEDIIRHKDLVDSTREMVKAEFRRDLDKYKCRINLAKTNEEKFECAIECVAYLTDDKLFREMHIGKGTKYEQNNTHGKIDKRSRDEILAVS